MPRNNYAIIMLCTCSYNVPELVIFVLAAIEDADSGYEEPGT